MRSGRNSSAPGRESEAPRDRLRTLNITQQHRSMQPILSPGDLTPLMRLSSSCAIDQTISLRIHSLMSSISGVINYQAHEYDGK